MELVGNQLDSSENFDAVEILGALKTIQKYLPRSYQHCVNLVLEVQQYCECNPPRKSAPEDFVFQNQSLVEESIFESRFERKVMCTRCSSVTSIDENLLDPRNSSPRCGFVRFLHAKKPRRCNAHLCNRSLRKKRHSTRSAQVTMSSDEVPNKLENWKSFFPWIPRRIIPIQRVSSFLSHFLMRPGMEDTVRFGAQRLYRRLLENPKMMGESVFNDTLPFWKQKFEDGLAVPLFFTLNFDGFQPLRRQRTARTGSIWLSTIFLLRFVSRRRTCF